MAISLSSLISGNVAAASANSAVASTASNGLDRVHQELDNGNPMVFKLELNSSLNAVEAQRAKNKKLDSTISALGGIGYLKTSSKKSPGNLFTDVSLLPKIKDALTEEWIDKDNFLAMVALRKEAQTLTEEQIAENDLALRFGKAVKHNANCGVVTERLITKPFLKSVISKLLQNVDLDDETSNTASEWIDSGNQDVKLYFNDLERFVSMQDVRESAGLVTIYFTLWNNEAEAILAPAKKPVSMPNGSLGLVWYLTPLAVTFEAGKTTSLKRPLRVVDGTRSQAVKAAFDNLFEQPKAKKLVDVVPSSFFEDIVSYNLANVKTGSKGHHEYRDELFAAANNGQWNAKAEKLLLEIGKSEKHTKFSTEQAQAMIAKAKSVMNDFLAASAISAPAEVTEVQEVYTTDVEVEYDDEGLEPVSLEGVQEFFSSLEKEQLLANELAASFGLSSEGE